MSRELEHKTNTILMGHRTFINLRSYCFIHTIFGCTRYAFWSNNTIITSFSTSYSMPICTTVTPAYEINILKPLVHSSIIMLLRHSYILSVITKYFFPTKFNIIIYKYQQTVSSIHQCKFFPEIFMILSLDKHSLLFIH